MHNQLARICAAVCVFLCALSGAPPGRAAEASGAVPTGPLPAAAAPTRYRLDLTIRPKLSSFSGTVEIDVTLKEPARFLYLHGKELNVTKAELVSRNETESAKYTQVSRTGVARVDFGREWPAGPLTLRFAFNAPYNDGLDGLYRASDSGNWYAFSQFEAISARYLFPCFDQPSFKTPFDIRVTAEQEDAVVSNTPAVKTQMLPGGLKRVTFATTEPLPTYLLAFAVGPLDVVKGPDIPATKLRARPIPLGGVAVKGKGDQLAIALEQTPAIVTILEDYFGIPYPFAKLDLIAAADFAAGAMENAGAIAYRETRVLLEPKAPITQMREFELVHAHELAHQWFGDLVTPRWWDDIWLNEAFATWMGNKSTAVWQPNDSYERQTIYRASDTMNEDALAHARRIREPVDDEDGIANAFDGITYQKGAGVLAMFESYLGPESFRRGVQNHLTRFRFGVASANDFFQSLAQGSGHPEIVPAFQTFLDQPGLPLVEAKVSCQGSSATLSLAQRPFVALGGVNPTGRQWQVPVCARLGGGDASCTLLKGAKSEVKLAKCPAYVMPNANGAGYYRFALDAAGWAALFANEGQLNAAERLALIKNTGAALKAGLLAPGDALAYLMRSANAPEWDLTRAALYELEFVRNRILDKAAQARLDARTTAILAPRLASLGIETRTGEDANTTLLRTAIADFLVRVARDPKTIAAMAPKGAAALRDLPAADANTLESALRAGVEAQGGPFARKIIAAVEASRDSQFRRTGLAALASNPDAASLKADVFPIVLSRAYKTNEATLLIEELVRNPERRAAAWPWLKANFDAYAARLGQGGGARAIDWINEACSSEMRADVDAFYRPRIGDLRGGPRRLALALDQIDQCLALKAAQGAAINAYFAN